MPRRRAQAYRSSELSELARQLLYAPPTQRAEVVRRAERWHDELDAGKNYPIDYVVFRLTQRRIRPSESVMLVGEALRPDLRLLIDALSRSIELPPDADDPGETTAELADRLGVSTKTVGRWRDAGLRWRWVVRESGGKPTVVIQRSAVAAFNVLKGGRVESASGFSRLSESEQDRLIKRAGRLADATDAPPQAIIDHLARRSGRSAEAIRQLIGKHDATHPGEAVFADRAGPLTDKQKRVIDRAYRSGIGVAKICRHFGKTRSTIYRAIHEARAQRALAKSITLIAMPIFDRDDADEVILRSIRNEGPHRRLSSSVIQSLPVSLRPVFDRPFAPDPVSRSLIVRYNFLKHRAGQVQDILRTGEIRAADLDRFDELCERAKKTCGRVVAGLLPSVLSVVRRQISGDREANHQELVGLLDRGITVLLEEIERFDPALSHTVESVLTNRLLRELAKPDAGQALTDERALLQRLYDAGVAAEAMGIGEPQ